MAKTRFRSLTGGPFTVVFPDEQIPVATASGIAFKLNSRGRVTLQPEGTSVNQGQADLLRLHARYGEAFISEADIQKRLAAAGAKNPKVAKEDELRARIQQLEAQIANTAKEISEAAAAASAQAPADEPEAETGESPIDEEIVVEDAQEPAESASEPAPSTGAEPEEKAAATVNAAIAYLVRYQDASPDAVKDAGGPIAYGATLNPPIVFPNLK